MKKINTMRAAGGLLIATLLTTSAVSGTYAKYVSGGSAGDTARVAKWGIVIAASGNLFSKNYLNATDNTPTTSTTAADISVASSNTDMLVAPGTKSATGLTLGITGTPEVDTKVKAKIEAKDVYLAAGTYGVMEEVKSINANNYSGYCDDGLYTLASSQYTKIDKVTPTGGGTAEYPAFDSNTKYYRVNKYTNAVVGTDGYYPVQFTYGSATAQKANDVAATIATAIKGATLDTSDYKTENGLTTYTIENIYECNTDLSTKFSDLNGSISWEWEYETDTTDHKWDNVDYEDTILGDLIAGTEVVLLTTDSTSDTTTGTVLTVSNGMVKKGDTVVGCLTETFNITLEAVQVD